MHLKSITLIIFLSTICFSVSAQVSVSKAYIDSLYQKYPVKKSNFSAESYEWDNPYFKTIADVALHQSIVTYAVFTKAKEIQTEQLHLERKGVLAAWRHIPEMPDEGRLFVISNKKMIKPDQYDKGHFSGWELNACCLDAAILSDTYTFNAAVERHAQNEGTELGIEFLTRYLVGYVRRGHRPDVPLVDSVRYWKGAYGSLGTLTDGEVTDNYPAVYWNLLQYGNEIHAYWFPNDLNGAGQVRYKRFEIPYDSADPQNLGLIQRLHFDPRKLLN